MSNSALERLEAEVMALRQQVRQLEQVLAPLVNAKVRPPSRAQIGRIASKAGAGGSALYTAKIQRVDPEAQNEDTTFTARDIRPAARDGELQPFAQDFILVELEHFRFLQPVPGRLVAVIIETISDGAFGQGTGKFASMTADPGSVTGGEPTGTGPAIPLLSVNPPPSFHLSTLPYDIGNVLVGQHVWPLLDEAGESTLDGVDKDDGFFLVYPMAPGALAKTFDLTVSLDSGDLPVVLRVSGDVDGQGNLLDLRFAKEAP